MADQLEQQLVERLNLTPAQERALPDVLAELGLPMEHVDPAKAPKDSAAYTDKGPRPFICQNCEHYGEGSCEIVDGQIDPKGSCRWWHAIHDHPEEPDAYEHVAVYNKQGD